MLTDKQKARILEGPGPGPVTCPLLEDGACTVYEVRPITCRMHGFYTERDAGLHCGLVTDAVNASNELVTWGNGEAVAADLRDHGPERSLADWLTASRERPGRCPDGAR